MLNERENKSRSCVPALKRCALFAALGFSMAAVADDYDAGVEAYLAEQYQTAMSHFSVSAGQGNPQAKYLLGTMYRKGLGVKADEFTAFKWIREAAVEGVVDAQFQLGLMYYDGIGTTEDGDEALNWVSLAANAGHEDASEVLNVMLTVDFGFGC